MGSGGMTVFGTSGIRITKEDKTTELVKIDNEGITLKYGAAMKIKDSGTITFIDDTDPQNVLEKTAITKLGITCDALTSGTLLIAGTGANIKVGSTTNPTVTIDQEGIKIKNAELTVWDKTGEIKLIDHGIIQANAIQLGVAGSNILKNGRADFGIDSWIVDGTPVPVVTQDNIYRVSGSHSFKISTSTTGLGMKQILHQTLV